MGRILVEWGEYKKIAEVFNVSTRTVRDACKARSESKLAQRIRKAAIERGGVAVENKACAKNQNDTK